MVQITASDSNNIREPDYGEEVDITFEALNTMKN